MGGEGVFWAGLETPLAPPGTAGLFSSPKLSSWHMLCNFYDVFVLSAKDYCETSLFCSMYSFHVAQTVATHRSKV